MAYNRKITIIKNLNSTMNLASNEDKKNNKNGGNITEERK
jgi:hypothetical protein